MSKVEEILGADAAALLQHECKTIPKEQLQLPGPDYVERCYGMSDRPTRVLTSLQALVGHGRLGGPATCRSCPWIRASSIPPARRSRRTRRTSIPRTS